MVCEFHGSNGNGFGDIWWTDNPIYFSSIDIFITPFYYGMVKVALQVHYNDKSYIQNVTNIKVRLFIPPWIFSFSEEECLYSYVRFPLTIIITVNNFGCAI